MVDLIPIAERGPYFGLLAAVWALASAIGPPVGGALSSAGQWRWLFYSEFGRGHPKSRTRELTNEVCSSELANLRYRSLTRHLLPQAQIASTHLSGETRSNGLVQPPLHRFGNFSNSRFNLGRSRLRMVFLPRAISPHPRTRRNRPLCLPRTVHFASDSSILRSRSLELNSREYPLLPSLDHCIGRLVLLSDLSTVGRRRFSSTEWSTHVQSLFVRSSFCFRFVLY